MTAKQKTKKITAKRKAAPSPVVVLEEWNSSVGMFCYRLVDDAERDVIETLYECKFGSKGFIPMNLEWWEWKAMPV